MDTLGTIFDLALLEQAISSLAATTPFPGESQIRDAFSGSRRGKNFPGASSRRYPETPSTSAFRSKMCDLRAAPNVWVEFKHGTSLRYIQELGFEDAQGTTKDLFRNACMDLAKTTLINQAEDFTGLVILSVLHVGELQDESYARCKVELEALGIVFRTTPECIEFPYPACEGERTVKGVLSIYTFGRPRP